MNSVHDGSKRHAESKLNAAVRIRSAFIMNKKGEAEALTWNQIRERSGLSKGALSKYLTQLIEEGCVKGEIRVMDHRQMTFYQWVPGKGTAVAYVDEESHECFRFYVPRDKTGETLVREGIKIRSGKTVKGKEKEVFRGHGPVVRLKREKRTKLSREEALKLGIRWLVPREKILDENDP